MSINKIKTNPSTREMEILTVNNVARFLRGFNDSLLVEDDLDIEELQLIDNIFSY